MRKMRGRHIHTALSYLRHPCGVTCLDCGFLALGNLEVSTANRILLHCRGTAGCPPLEDLKCYRSLWVEYELSYTGTVAEEIFDAVQVQRRDCVGFFRYRPGWAPAGHQDLLLKARDKKEKIGFVLLGSALTLLAAWLAKLLGLR